MAKAMGKEVKIGLAVIGSLLIVLGGALYYRLTNGSRDTLAQSPDTPPGAAPDAAATAQTTLMTPAANDGSPYRATLTSGVSPDAGDQSSPAGNGYGNNAPAGGFERQEPPQPFMTDANAAAPSDPSGSDPNAQAPPSGRRSPFARDEDTVGPASGALVGDAATTGAGGGADSGSYAGSNGNGLSDPQTTAPPAYDSAASQASQPPATLPADPSYSGDAAAANDPPMNQAVAAAGQSGGVSFAPPRRFRGEPAPVSQGAAAPSGYNNDGYAAAGSATAGGYSQNGGYAAPVSQPPITAVAAQAPIAQGPSEPGQYVVQPNDNFWTISEKVYGVGAFFKALQRFNAAEFPQSRRLQVGDVVAVPPTATLRQKFPDLCPKQKRERMASQMQPVAASPRHRLDAKIYVVEQGDTLFDIARRQLGKASRWPEIYELNRGTLGEDFDYLRAGTELVMPSDGQQPQDTLTRQPSDRFQR